ncbi:MAG: DUF58 domain-containing protein [Bryobacteraceae bacterium]
MGGYGHAARVDSDEPLLDPSFLSRLEKLALEWRDRFAGPGGGSRTSRHRGAGQEFFEHRHFCSGDDLRAVNWRAYMRFETLFLKTFQLEPRVPIRLLLDASASMTAGGADDRFSSSAAARQTTNLDGLPHEPTKFDYARRLAAALTYIGLVQLDSILLQPFSDRLLVPEMASGGRQRFAAAEKCLRGLHAAGRTDFLAVAREFLDRYPQRGLAIVISDFLEDSGTLRPLQYIAAAGHELMLVQIWSEEERRPTGDGDFELIDAESGAILKIALDKTSRQAYTDAFDRHEREVRELALRNGGRHAAIHTGMPIEQAVFGPLALRRKS